MNWFEKHLDGHKTFRLFGHRVTVYGFNAMHVVVNIWTERWGYICFHPTMRVFGHWWPWYLYASPNATPWAASWGLGPGLDREEKERIKKRSWTDVYRRINLLKDYLYDMRQKPMDEHERGFANGLVYAIGELMENPAQPSDYIYPKGDY